MALITCSECGNQVSGTAKACPQCGAKGKALSGPKKQLGTNGKLVIGGIVAAVAIGAMTTNQSSPPSPQQQAANEATKARMINVVTYAKSLTVAARNPDSVVFERVLANGDGSLTCFKYRAQNGFGGTNHEWAAFTPRGGQTRGGAVKAICEDKDMQDVTDGAVRMIKLMG